MGMGGETPLVVGGIVGMEVIEHQEGIQLW
jgi:hypothetical protein